MASSRSGVGVRLLSCRLYALLMVVVDGADSYVPGPPGWAKTSTWLSVSALILTCSSGPAYVILTLGKVDLKSAATDSGQFSLEFAPRYIMARMGWAVALVLP